MPASSKQQFKFMKSVEKGYIHPKGLSKTKAKEFTTGVHPSELPTKVEPTSKNRFNKLHKHLLSGKK